MTNIDKKNIILSNNKYEFIWFMQEKKEEVLELLDDYGIELLYKRADIEATINGILTSSNKSLETLFLNNNFCLFIDKYFDKALDYIYCLSEVSIMNYAKYLKANNKGNLIEQILFKVKVGSQIGLLEAYVSINDVAKQLFRLKDDTISYVLQNLVMMGNKDIIDRLNPDNLINRGIKIPNYLLNSKEFNDNIASTLDYYKYRLVIKTLEKRNDVEKLEKTRKVYVNNVINNIKDELLEVYDNIYTSICNGNSSHNLLSNIYENITKTKIKDDYYNLMLSFPFVLENDEEILEKLKEYFKLDTNHLVANLIVDYHFKDSYKYVSKSIKSIMDYVTTTGKKLISNERLYLYHDFYNIESLTIEEKLELHNKSKKYDLVSMLYDDVRLCKDSSYNSLKDEMINEENYTKYLDEKLSKKYNINVLYLNGQKFRMLVKSLNVNINYTLEKEMLTKATDGGSYSYIGNEKLSTFYEPQKRYNIVYTDFDINNIVHVYPVDSFSSYSHDNLFKEQLNIYEKDTKIMSPTDLIESGHSYNEIIIAQKNNKDNYDHVKSNPIPGYILCYDEINYNQAKSAKKLGLGLVLVDTSKYNEYINGAEYSMHDIHDYNVSPILVARRKYKEIIENTDLNSKIK